jgi:class 3 adenylate cyclase
MMSRATRYARYNQEQKLAEQDHLKLKNGIHSGPCLLVTLNDRLDYFGTTVNAAARVQAQAKVNEIVFTEEFRHDLTDNTLLAGLTLQKAQLILRGLDQRPFTVYRAQVERRERTALLD